MACRTSRKGAGTGAAQERPCDQQGRLLETRVGPVALAPLLAGLAVRVVDPGAGVAAKETLITMGAALAPPVREELLAEVARELQAMSEPPLHPLTA